MQFMFPVLLISLIEASGVQAMGVIRPGFGTVGKAIKVLVNALPMPVPEHTVYHYDGESRYWFILILLMLD